MVLGSWLNYALKPSNPSLTFQRNDLSHAPERVQSTARDKTLLLTTKHIKKVIAKLSKMKLAYRRLIDSCWSTIFQANSSTTTNNNAFKK
jgi:hypothetical protein